MLAFSTCWNNPLHTDGRALVDQIRGLGLHTIELAAGLKISLLPGIKQAVQDNSITISSVEATCPAPLEEKGQD